MKALANLSVRTRLQSALAILALLTCFAGAVAWITLEGGQARLRALNAGTLAEVSDALRLSSDAADLATRMPFLLSLDSPFRVHQEGEHILTLIANIENRPDLQPGIVADLVRLRAAVLDLLAATQSRSALLDRILRLNAEVAREERSLAVRSATVGQSLYEGGEWLTLQRIASTLLGAGRAENLIGLGEFQREFHGLTLRLSPVATESGREARNRLFTFAEGDNGLFELRRRELAHRIDAANALVRIRIGAEIVSAYAAAVTATAQREIASELTSTTTMISVAKSTILIVMLISTAIALFTAQFVARYVTANLSAIADGMMRLAAGDRASSLPRSYGKGDEIGKLLRAFRVFRANAIRLDRAHRQRIRQTALWETMVLGMSDGVAVLAPGGGITATNDRLADVLGVPPSSLAGPVNLDHLLKANGWRSTTTASDYAELTDPDGRTIERRDRALPAGGAVALFSDATERRQLQERMQQIQRIEGLAKISGEVAHDFGNILSTISSSTHMLEAASPERSRELRHTIASAVELGTFAHPAAAGICPPPAPRTRAGRAQLSRRWIDRPYLFDSARQYNAQRESSRGRPLRSRRCGPVGKCHHQHLPQRRPGNFGQRPDHHHPGLARWRACRRNRGGHRRRHGAERTGSCHGTLLQRQARRHGDGAGARHGLRVHSSVQWRRADRIGGGARHGRKAYSSAHRPDRRIESTFASLAPESCWWRMTRQMPNDPRICCARPEQRSSSAERRKRL